MSVTAVARRYAEALADVAIARNQTEEITGELRAFAEMVKSSRELYGVFASPVLSQREKGKVLDALISRARPGQPVANLLKAMLRHYRLHYVEAVYEQFRREMNERKGIVLARVTTAGPLSAAEQQALSRKIQEMTGKTVQLEFNTDPSLIGGAVTRIGSTVYDGSIRTQLEGIKQRLKAGERA
ncbi:MAG TPA: ATP synthase F1 subunit delta [Blastocatellia bacterium]|nr:ATP synthase F1 subunit delta [Blastocatellia bacterium]